MPAKRNSSRRGSRPETRRADSGVAALPSCFAFLDGQLRFLRLDKAFLQMHGLIANNTVGKALRDVFPGMAALLEPAAQQVIATGNPVLNIEISADAAQSGAPRQWLVSCFAGRDGNSVGLAFQEITNVKAREESLAECQKSLRAILDNSPILIFLKDQEGRYLLVSKEFERVFRISEQEIRGKTDEEVFPPEQATLFRTNDAQVLRTGLPMAFEEFAIYDDGPRTSIVTKFPVRGGDGEIYATGGIVTDISQLKEAMETARSQLQLLEFANEAIVVLALDWTIQFWNRGAERLYGWKKEEALGKNIRVLLKTTFPNAGDGILPHLFRKVQWEGEGTQIRKDGQRIPVSARYSLERDENGTPSAVLAIYVDLSDRKQTEEKLRQTEEHFRLLLEGIKDYAIYMVNPDGIIVSWNAGAERIKGYRAEEMIGQHCSCLYTTEDRKARKPEMSLAIASAQSTYREEGWRLRKDGTRFWADAAITALRDAHGTLRGFVKLTRDATDRRQIEEERRRLSARLLKMQDKERRQLARELHDSTAQHLTALSTYLAVIQKSALDRRARKALSECRALAEECHREIRTFSYLLHPPILDEIGLPDAVRWYCEGFTKRSGIPVDLSISSNVGRLPPEVEGAVFRIVQESLANIHRHSGSPMARIRIDRNETQLILEVRDEGHGLPSEVLQGGRISRARVGVGISGMEERIRQLQGHFDIESGSDGTTVRTIIPVSEGG